MSVWTAIFCGLFSSSFSNTFTQSNPVNTDRVSVLRGLNLEKMKWFSFCRKKRTIHNNEVSVKRDLLILNHFFEGWSLDNLHEEWCNQPLGWRADIYWQSFGRIAS